MSTWVTSWSSSRCLALSGGKGLRCLCGARTCRWPLDAAVGAEGLARSPLLECGQDLWYGRGDGLSLPRVPGAAGDCPACRPALGAAASLAAEERAARSLWPEGGGAADSCDRRQGGLLPPGGDPAPADPERSLVRPWAGAPAWQCPHCWPTETGRNMGGV